jgi:hypothetical protein
MVGVTIDFKLAGADVRVYGEAATPAEARRFAMDALGMDAPLVEAFTEPQPIVKPPQRKPRKPKVAEAQEVVIVPLGEQLGLFGSATVTAVPDVQASPTAISKQQITEAVINFAREHGYDAALGLIRQFQKEDGSRADKAGDIQEANYPTVLEEIAARAARKADTDRQGNV